MNENLQEKIETIVQFAALETTDKSTLADLRRIASTSALKISMVLCEEVRDIYRRMPEDADVREMASMVTFSLGEYLDDDAQAGR